MIITVRYDRNTYNIEVEHNDRHLIVPVSSETIYRTDPAILNRDISERIAHAFGVEPQDIRYSLNYLVQWILRRHEPSEWEYRTGVSVPVSCRHVEERRPFTEEDYQQLRELLISENPPMRPRTVFPNRLTPSYEYGGEPRQDNRARLYRDARVSWTNLAGSLRTETISFDGFFDPSTLGYEMPQGITKEKKGEADQRAKELLLEHMSKEQKQQFGDGSNPFICTGNVTGTRYKLYSVRQGGIYAIDREGNRAGHYCLVQSGLVPLYDQLLAQKMLIENDEERFLKIANKL